MRGESVDLHRRPYVGGLDLAASERRCSGFVLLNRLTREAEEARCLFSDEQIVKEIESVGVSVLAVDAPLTDAPRMREVDRKLISMGFRVLPPSFGAMRELTSRAWRISQRLSAEVIETHPRSALKSARVSSVGELLERLGLRSRRELGSLGRDERDALIAAVVALCYSLRSCSLEIAAGDGKVYLLTL
ncbi:MAG: hypothetical protein NZ902_06260 [Acidilobaceae archaeon]|nr:hypothetical protein [Acidilobaceae archaeon]MCX8166187.1 hypothetical protein [Acidilobaceae archaeon]MDW7974825.1 hypothetical protein [Sulfolobales archaeon]